MFGPASWSKTLSNLNSMFLIYTSHFTSAQTLGTLHDAYPGTAWLAA
jgi:hypothetical protein